MDVILSVCIQNDMKTSLEVAMTIIIIIIIVRVHELYAAYFTQTTQFGHHIFLMPLI